MTTALRAAVFGPIRGWLSEATLTRKASLNALASALDYGARVLAVFLITPLMVRGLGDYGYGVWQVLGRLIGYANPASGRPSQALKWTIARVQSSTDYDEKRRQVGSAVLVWLGFLPLLALVGGALAWLAPIWLQAPPALWWTVRAATALLVVDRVVTSLATLPKAVLEGENLGYRRMGLSAALVFVGAGFTALALHAGGGLVGVAAAELAATVLTGALFLHVVRANVPWFGLARPRPGAGRAFLGLSGWFLAWNLVMQTMRASDVVILGILASPALVTQYSLTRYAPETIVSLVALVVFGVTPGLGGIIGAGDKRRAARVRSDMMAFTWLLVTALGATILLWNRSFVELWVGPRHYVGATSNLLLMAMVAQFVFLRNDANIIDLTLDLRHKVLAGLCSAALSVVAGAVAVGAMGWGITGLCVGLIAGRLVLSLGYPWLVGRFLGVPLASQLRGALRPALATALLFLLAAAGSRQVAAGSWWALAMGATLTAPAAALAAFYAGASAGRRRSLLQRAREVVPGKRPGPPRMAGSP